MLKILKSSLKSIDIILLKFIIGNSLGHIKSKTRIKN